MSFLKSWIHGNLKGGEKSMIEEKLLISYLKKQTREYNKQVVILQNELTSSLMYNHKSDYLIKKFAYESMMNVIRVYEDLIEKIKNGEFDKVKKSDLSTYTSLSIIFSVTKEEGYNEDFINEMKRIEEEKSEKLHKR